MTPSEKAKLCKYAEKEKGIIEKSIIILLNSGLRRGELLGLQWKNINLSTRQMTINKTLSRMKKFNLEKSAYTYVRVDSYAADKRKTALYLGPVKTLKSRRTIFLLESVYQAFVEIKTLHEKYATQKEYNNSHDLVFCSSNGRAFDPKTYDDEFKKILSKANIREINIYATRHTFATEAMQKSNDIVTIADIMGHSKPSTTLDMYGHTFDDRKRALMEQFE